MSQDRRVVVTGMGVMTPVGNDVETCWSNLKEGVSGIGPITLFDTADFETRIAGEVKDFEPVKWFKVPKDTRRADRFTQLAMAASKQAMADAGLTGAVGDPERFGVMLGSGIGGLKSLADQHAVLLAKGPSRISPFMIPMMISNMASGLVSMEFGLQGPNFCPVSACATSAHSIGEAWRMIREGEADAFLAGGSEATIVPLGIAGFAAMKALSRRNDEPAKASRPWDRDRDGFVMGEGAGVVILEELEHARKRGARIHAEIVGYGLSADAYHMTSPLPNHEQAQRSMRSGAGARAPEYERRRVYQCARHQHLRRRYCRDSCREGHLWRLREKRTAGLLDQVDDRAFARRGRRGGDGHLRPGDSGRRGSADHQSGSSG